MRNQNSAVTRIVLALGASLLVGTILTSWVVADSHEKTEENMMYHMEELNGHINKIRRYTRRDRPVGPEMVENVLAMQKHAIASKAFEPAGVKDIPDDKKQAYLNGFRKMMNDMIVEMMVLEMAVVEGKQDVIKASIDRLLEEHKAKGHEAYYPEE